jgi:uncharacterized protein DUF4440
MFGMQSRNDRYQPLSQSTSMTSQKKVSLLAFVFVLFVAAPVVAGLVPSQRQPAASASCRGADSTAVMRVARRFHEILSTGDTTGINTLLADDLRVLEGGTVENRQEYLSHHLSADIAFAKAVKEERTSFSYKCEGSVAWLVSTSTATGKFSGRDINSDGAELLLLSRTPKGWKIRAIQWSSARRQPR